MVSAFAGLGNFLKVCPFGNFHKDFVVPPSVPTFSKWFRTAGKDVMQGTDGCSVLLHIFRLLGVCEIRPYDWESVVITLGFLNDLADHWCMPKKSRVPWGSLVKRRRQWWTRIFIPSTSNRKISWNCFRLDEFNSLGSKQPSASAQRRGSCFFFHAWNTTYTMVLSFIVASPLRVLSRMTFRSSSSWVDSAVVSDKPLFLVLWAGSTLMSRALLVFLLVLVLHWLTSSTNKVGNSSLADTRCFALLLLLFALQLALVTFYTPFVLEYIITDVVLYFGFTILSCHI